MDNKLNFDNHIIKSIDEFYMTSNATNELLFAAEELNENGTLTNGEDIVFGVGSQGRRISSLKRNKTASYTFTNAYISLNQMAAQSGTEVVTSDVPGHSVPCMEILEVGTDANSVATTHKAEGTAGAEIVAYRALGDNTQGEKLVQGATASASEFSYDPATKKITLPTAGFKAGDRILVVYNYLAKGKRVANRADTYSKGGRSVLTGTCCSPCDQETLLKFTLVMPYSELSGAYDLPFGGDQSTHPATVESLPIGCGRNKELWYYVVHTE